MENLILLFKLLNKKKLKIKKPKLVKLKPIKKVIQLHYFKLLIWMQVWEDLNFMVEDQECNRKTINQVKDQCTQICLMVDLKKCLSNKVDLICKEEIWCKEEIEIWCLNKECNKDHLINKISVNQWDNNNIYNNNNNNHFNYQFKHQITPQIKV